ncbi:MAG: hypothetical protein ACAH83_17995 [Alphaproteobacteria bacterium]
MFLIAVVALFLAMGCIEPAEARRMMSQNVIQASSGFQSLISTLCWLVGFGFTISGCFKFFQMFRRGGGDPTFHRLKEKALFRLFVGFGFLAFPFIQSAYYVPTYYGGYYGGRQFTENAETSAQQFLQLFAVACWYFGIMSFFFGNLALGRALKNKDDPASAALKEQAAVCLLFGFLITAIPFACASFMGVELW